MTINDKLFDYLEHKIKNFTKVKENGQIRFTCPRAHLHQRKTDDPSCTVMAGSEKIFCMQCSFKGNIFDVVRLIEEDKKNKSDAEITNYLINSMKVDMYKELDYYIDYGFSCVPVAKNGKRPIETNWTEISHKDKVSFIKWLNNGLNIGIRTGEVSDITVIDVDNKVIIDPDTIEKRKDFITILDKSKTLMQNSANGGRHYVFKYDKDIPQTVDIAGIKIDTRCDGGQFLCSPSVIDGKIYSWINLGVKINPMSEDLKCKLLELLKVEKGRSKVAPMEDDRKLLIGESIENENKPLLKNNNLEGGRNDTFVRMGGILINKLSVKDTEFVLKLMNRQLLEKPLDEREIEAMLGSLSQYKVSDEESHEKAIYNFLKMMQNDVDINDIVKGCFAGDRAKEPLVYKYLSKFVTEGRAIRMGRGRYKWREKIEWNDKFPTLGQNYKYKVPFFNEVSHFEEGNIIMIGGKTGQGKTHQSMNIIKFMIAQGIKPYYVYSEAGSGWLRIANKLGIAEGSFYRSYHSNPLAIEIEPNSFTIIDWLLVEDKSITDVVFKHINEEMERKGGILIVMSQLKENYEWFAPNMCKDYPSLTARYIFDDESGKSGHFQIDKMRSPKGDYRTYTINCTYDHVTKIFKTESLI